MRASLWLHHTTYHCRGRCFDDDEKEVQNDDDDDDQNDDDDDQIAPNRGSPKVLVVTGRPLPSVQCFPKTCKRVAPSSNN